VLLSAVSEDGDGLTLEERTWAIFSISFLEKADYGLFSF